MAMLILLNGPPASGKSTLAQRLSEQRSTMVNLDIDVIRSGLAEWPTNPEGAGFAAREVALDQARTHLGQGHDVVIPQLLGRLDFVEQLDALAADVGVRFVEIALQIDRDAAAQAFHDRSAAGKEQAHRDAAMLVDQSSSEDPLGDMFDAVERLAEQRPRTHRIHVESGHVTTTLAALNQILGL